MENKEKKETQTEVFEGLLARQKKKECGKYILTLYVAGQTPRSQEAIKNVRHILDEKLKGKYELDIVDIFQQPLFAKEGQIVAAPTLIKKLPPPLRRFIGSMSNTDKILAGLDIRSKPESKKSRDHGKKK